MCVFIHFYPFITEAPLLLQFNIYQSGRLLKFCDPLCQKNSYLEQFFVAQRMLTDLYDVDARKIEMNDTIIFTDWI